jgi:hypothetical protein
MAGKQSTPPASTTTAAAPAPSATGATAAASPAAAPATPPAPEPAKPATLDPAQLEAAIDAVLMARFGLTAEQLAERLAQPPAAAVAEFAPAAGQAFATGGVLDAAAVAAMVQREVTYRAAGAEPRVQLVPVHAEEVLDWKDYGSHVVVVTKDGQKFSSARAH